MRSPQRAADRAGTPEPAREAPDAIVAEVAHALRQLPVTLAPDRLESRIIMELAIRYRPDPGPGAQWPDPLHPDVRHAVARVEDCFCRYREELVAGEAPATARGFWVAAALRILRRAAGPGALQALVRESAQQPVVIELPQDAG